MYILNLEAYQYFNFLCNVLRRLEKKNNVLVNKEILYG